ncbi:MAG: phospholipase [Candidatus Lambdaproteobacteria bacterium]|nr:phospholipase [Candidatus Lambdaproteobacteria bacterium]
MDGIGRRCFIRGTAAAALAVLDAARRPAQAEPRVPAKLTDLDHVIILMKENRSFDHYFGTLRGVRGFDDPPAAAGKDGRSVFQQRDPEHPEGHVLPFRLDTTRTSAQRLPDLPHSWRALHRIWNGGRLDAWIPTHRAVRTLPSAAAPLAMGYHTREDLPCYHALADAFTVCDGYHASVLGPTHPNRYQLMTGTLDPEGRGGGPAIDNRRRTCTWETYPERLERAGITWRIYHDSDDYGCNVLKYFARFRTAPPGSPLHENALRDRPFAELLRDLRTGNIPQVSWIVPPTAVTEHPPYLPAAGEHHTRQVLDALWANPALWARTALILNYDENDGLFDHVAPPTPEPGTSGEFVRGQPIGLGFRVPCLLISPFSRGGYVCGDTFDHTSTLRLLEARFGVEVAALSPWRRRVSGDLTRAFGFGEPPRQDVPPLPETEPVLRVAERNAATLPAPAVPEQQAMARQEPGTRPRRGSH